MAVVGWSSAPLHSGYTRNGTGTVTVSIAGLTTGNMLLLYAMDEGAATAPSAGQLTGTGAIISVTVIQGVTRTGQGMAILACIIPAGLTGVTYFPGSVSFASLYVEEWSGNPTTVAAALDVSNSTTGGGSTFSAGAGVTTTNATDLLVSYCGLANTNGGAKAWTSTVLTGGLTTATLSQTGYLVQSATGTYTPVANWTTSRAYMIATIALKPQPTLGASTSNFTSTAAGTWAFAGTGNGFGPPPTQAQFTSAGAATVGLTAASLTPFTNAQFTSTAAHTVVLPAIGSNTTTFTGTAVGTVSLAGTSALTTAYTGTAVGTVNIDGEGSETTDVEFAATAVGIVYTNSTWAGTFASTANGTVVLVATGNNSTTFTSTAVGTQGYNKQGSQDSTYSGTSAGVVSVQVESAQDTLFDATATATITFPALSTSIVAYSGAAVGVASGLAFGLGSLTVGYFSIAQATVTLMGAGTAAVTFTSTAVESQILLGQGATQIAFTSTAVGLVVCNATGTLNIGYTGNAAINNTFAGAGSLTIGCITLATRYQLMMQGIALGYLQGSVAQVTVEPSTATPTLQGSLATTFLT